MLYIVNSTKNSYLAEAHNSYQCAIYKRNLAQTAYIMPITGTCAANWNSVPYIRKLYHKINYNETELFRFRTFNNNG